MDCGSTYEVTHASNFLDLSVIYKIFSVLNNLKFINLMHSIFDCQICPFSIYQMIYDRSYWICYELSDWFQCHMVYKIFKLKYEIVFWFEIDLDSQSDYVFNHTYGG